MKASPTEVTFQKDEKGNVVGATFVERFDEMTPARYEQWIKESGAKASSHSH